MKYELLEQTTSCWVGQNKYRRFNMEESWQEAQSNPRTGQDGRINEVLQEIAAQVCTYKVYMNVIHMKRKAWGVVNYLCNSLFMLDLFVAHI